MKKFSYGNLQEFTNEMEKRFASKESLGAVATLDKVGMDNLADALKSLTLPLPLGMGSVNPNVIGEGNVITGIAYDQDTGKLSVKKELTALTEADFEEYTSEEIKSLFS